MKTTQITCAGCIWEDGCRAAGLCSTRCCDYCDELSEIAYSLLSYEDGLIERTEDYIQLMEEQQS